MTTDDSGNIYVSGTFDNGSNQDVKTIKYDSSGNQIWEIDFNGVFNGQEYLLDITNDNGSVVVTTQTEVESGLFRYATLKYKEIDYDSPSYPNETAFANGFIKNSGQLRTENEVPAYAVKYYSKTGDYQGFYKDDRFEFMTRTFHNDTTINDSAKKVVFAFTNAEPYLKARPMNKSEYFENYYFSYFPKKLERVPLYERMFYNEIWEGISLETCFNKTQEFSFTIGTKGSVNDIKIDVSGADSLVRDPSGELAAYTFNGAIKLGRPHAYQKNGSGELVELSWLPAFKLVGNQIRLDSIGSFNSQKDLTIRIMRDVQDVPETDGFCHSTYIGSPQVTVSDGVTDNSGKPIFCGTASGNSIFYLEIENSIWAGVPGVHDSGFITKMNRDMVPQFSTFLFVDGGGGYSEIRLHALAIDNENNIFSAGQIWADWAPTINQIGATFFEDQPLGGRDGYIVQLNGGSGEFIYGSFFGGENLANGMQGHDIINDIAINSQNELYIVGSNNTDATNNFPFTPLNGAYFQNIPIGHGGFIARFSSQEFQLDWCTNFSGNSNAENIYKIAISDNDLIGVAGRTQSFNSFIPVFSGTVQNLNPPGGADWYLGVFNSSGALTWGTYEGSTDSDFKGNCGIAFGSDKSLYFGANIFSTNGIIFQQSSGNGYINNTNSGPSNPGAYFFNYGLLVHYRPDVYNVTWRTLVMDGVSMNKLNSLAFKDDKLFVSGTTNDGTMPLVSSSSNLYSGAKTMGGFGSNLEGYLMVFGGFDQSLIHSSYFGGHRDDNQEAFVINDYAEIFGFGYSKSRYTPNFVGIPVKNNGVPNAWYNDGENYLAANSGYIFKWCAADTPLSIDEDADLNANQAFHIFPNPTISGNWLSIQTDSGIIEALRIVDVSGRTLFRQSENFSNYANSTRIHLPKLAPGIYLVNLKINGNEFSEKLVITD